MVGGLKHMPRDLEVKSCAKGIAQQLGYSPTLHADGWGNFYMFTGLQWATVQYSMYRDRIVL